MIGQNFINKSLIIHKIKYDYSLVDYINAKTKVKIICPLHGIFEQTPNNHLKGQNCPKCYGNKQLTNKEFIDRSNIAHGNLYDYSLVNYINAKTKVKIICNKHGIFEQTPDNHLNKKETCPICNHKNNGDRCRKTKNEFITESIKSHENTYDYSNVEYKNNNTKVKIICEKHGEFYQKPKHHIYGVGCPRCNKSKGETIIRNLFLINNVNYIEQKTFDDCKHMKLLYFDFYLPIYNICIEFDGEQHYQSKQYFGGDESFKLQQKRDDIKTSYCIKNNIKLIRIKHKDDIERIIQSLLENHNKP